VCVGPGADTVLDVCFDGRRVWSFWSRRDVIEAGPGRYLAAWPKALAARLKGTTAVTVLPHGASEPQYAAEIAFDDSGERLAIVNASGQPLGLDKSGKLVPTFDTRTPEQSRALLDSLVVVLDELHTAGIDAFPAYGTLLGAVREHKLIGHDSDADIGYVSRHEHPADVIAESFALQRRLVGLGYATARYSGASFQVKVVEPDGFVRGLDVFGGFLAGDVLHLMGEVRVPFEREWILPLGRCTLEGRELSAPARPEKLLEAMYGPGWKVPDPAYRFETPDSTVRAFNNYFRVTRARRAAWAAEHRRNRIRVGSASPSPLAEYVVAREGVPQQLIDLGAGQAVDSVWFARQGSTVVAYDYLTAPAGRARRIAEREGLRLDSRVLNFQEWRSVLSEGARIARVAGSRTLLAHHLFDATPRFGTDSIARFASMATRAGGTLYADFWCAGVPGEAQPWRPVDLADVAGVLERRGAHILETDEFTDPVHQDRRTGRVVALWQPASA
jgi:hypothetical protein